MKGLLILFLVIGVIAASWFIFTSSYNDSRNTENTPEETLEENDVETVAGETMNLVVYLQDKDAAILSDCGVTYKKEIQVAYTKAVADASLRYLFENELSQYGKYESVVIRDDVAEVTISEDTDASGSTASSLSSCEISHLFAVLEDTLTQYETIESVEVYLPTGKIYF